MQRDSRRRTVLKAVTWRTSATLTTTVLVYLFTGELSVAIEVGLLEFVAKLVFYYAHERLWDKIRFGKVELEPVVLWITGIPGSGKTLLGDMIYEELRNRNLKVQRLDSRDVRPLFPDIGFSREQVNHHIKRTGYLASMLEENGIVTVASFVSPYEESRQFVRGICRNYVEVHMDVSVATVRRAGVCDLYEQSTNGAVENLPGVDFEFEKSEDTEFVLTGAEDSLEAARDEIVDYLFERFL